MMFCTRHFKIKPARRADAALPEIPGHAQGCFVHLRPMNAFAIPEQFEIRALFRSRVQKSREPDQGRGDTVTVS